MSLDTGSVAACWATFGPPAPAEGRPTELGAGDTGPDRVALAWLDARTNWFELRSKESDPGVRLGLVPGGLVFDGGEFRWPNGLAPTPHLVDLKVDGETLHLLLAEPKGACRALGIRLVDGSPRFECQAIPEELFSGKRLRGMCWTHGVDRAQVSVFRTDSRTSTESSSALALGAINVGVLPPSLSYVLELPLEPDDEQGLDAIEDWWNPIAAVTRTPDQIVATMGLELHGDGAGALVRWSASKGSSAVSRKARTWDGTGGLDRGRPTGLGIFVARSEARSGRGGYLFSAAPHAGLESAVLCFAEPSLETKSVRHPIPDRWAASSQWTRLSPSTVPAGQSVYIFAEGGSAGSASAVPGSTGSLLELNPDRRRLVQEIR